LSGAPCGFPAAWDDIELGVDLLLHKFGKPFRALTVTAPIDDKI
jgi:hypothetical protein